MNEIRSVARNVGRADRAALRRVRKILHDGRDRPSPGDTAYNIYMAIMVAGVVVFPVLRAVVITFDLPQVLTGFGLDLGPQHIPAALAVLALATVALGTVRGPVVPSMPYIDLIVSSPLQRTLVLARNLRGSLMLTTFAVATVAAILIIVQTVRGTVDPVGVLLFGLASAAFGLLLGTAWLFGQHEGRTRRAALGVLTAGAAVMIAVTAVPGFAGAAAWLGPWGWITVAASAVSSGPSIPSVLAVVLTVFGAAAAGAGTPRILQRLDVEELRRQAQTWSAVASLAATGDVRSATNRLKTPPRIGRHWGAWRGLLGRSRRFVIVRRDARGLLRFPLRLVGWALTGLMTGSIVATLFATPGETTLLAFVAPLLAYLVVGGFAEGLRFHGSSLGSSSPWGLDPRTMTLLHALLPTLYGIVCTSLGAVATGVLISAPLGPIALWTVLLVVFAVVMQVFTSVKGLMPLRIMAPVPTPMGDASGINVVLWLIDAALLTVLLGGAATALAASGALGAGSIVLGSSALLMCAWASYRHHKQAHPDV